MKFSLLEYLNKIYEDNEEANSSFPDSFTADEAANRSFYRIDGGNGDEYRGSVSGYKFGYYGDGKIGPKFGRSNLISSQLPFEVNIYSPISDGADPAFLFLSKADAEEFKRRFIDPLHLHWPTRVTKSRSNNYILIRVDNNYDIPLYCRLVHAQKGAKFNPFIANRINSIESNFDEQLCLENFDKLVDDLNNKFLPLFTNMQTINRFKVKKSGNYSLSYTGSIGQQSALTIWLDIKGRLQRKTLKETDKYQLDITITSTSLPAYSDIADISDNLRTFLRSKDVHIKDFFAGLNIPNPIPMQKIVMENICDQLKDIFNLPSKPEFYRTHSPYQPEGEGFTIHGSYEARASDFWYPLTFVIAGGYTDFIDDLELNFYAADDVYLRDTNPTNPLGNLGRKSKTFTLEFNLSDYSDSDAICNFAKECLEKTSQISANYSQLLVQAKETFNRIVNRIKAKFNSLHPSIIDLNKLKHDIEGDPSAMISLDDLDEE